MNNTLFIVIPCYNEEEVLNETIKVINSKMQKLIQEKIISKNSRVMFINDGSSDNTWNIIKNISKKNNLFTGISLSKNCGHQNALVAGLLTAKEKADIVISLDADLQDDINVINQMIDKYNNGCQIVYGVRNNRKKDSFLKRFTAQAFYKLMMKLGVKTIYNHADYRLTSKKVLDEFENFKEVNLFLRGIFPLIGFKSDIVYYEREKRHAGESKYSVKKMFNFACDGITSFSTKPIRFIIFLGLIQSIISFICMITFIILNIIKYQTLRIESIVSIIFFISGIQILCIGIVGEYIGKAYFEIKKRPRYIIENNLMNEKKDEKRK